MTLTLLAHPSQLTAVWHSQFLSVLRTSTADWAAQNATVAREEGFSTAFRIRDWWLVQEDNTHIIQVYIDTSEGGGLVTADDCLRIHRWLMNNNVFDAFGDDFSIEISSIGAEPPLREVSDYKANIGKEIYLDTWEKVGDRQRYIMKLKDATEANVVLQEGTQTFEVPLDKVRWAYVRYQPEAPKHPKKSKKR